MSKRKFSEDNNKKNNGRNVKITTGNNVNENKKEIRPEEFTSKNVGKTQIGNDLEEAVAISEIKNQNGPEASTKDTIDKTRIGTDSEEPLTKIMKIGDDYKSPEPGTSDSRCRYSYNFWGPSKEEANFDNTVILNLKDLACGKYDKQLVRVRLTFKSEVKDTSIGKVVSFLGMDNTCEIAIVAFGRTAIHLFKNWEVNHVYSLKNFTCREENGLYPSGSSSKLQINANKDFVFEEVDDDSVIQPIPFQFMSIREIKGSNLSSRVDLVGILIRDFGFEVNSNNVPMRDLSITDRNKDMIIVTIWGPFAENFKSKENFPIVIRKGVVGSYNDEKKINCTSGILVLMDSKIDEAVSVHEWFMQMNK